MQDPLTKLPPELILRILEFTPRASLPSLTSASRAWHKFIDEIHQDAIYSSSTKTDHPPGARNLDFVNNATSFAKYYASTSWKDLCRRQTILSRNWDTDQPVTRESVIQIGHAPVWRFRPDFRRRFFVSTSQAGGLNVTDMDSGQSLWRLGSALHAGNTGQDTARPYARLEYQDGTACFDREGDAIEVWKTDVEDGMGRGEFRRVAVLEHECQTRGFQLSYKTLCVVSTEGKGFVYDFKETPPSLAKVLDIEHNAVGHLDQNEDVVMYGMGDSGYHVHSKATGELLTILSPSQCEDFYHIKHPLPRTARPAGPGRHGPTVRSFPPESPKTDRLAPITIHRNHFPRPDDAQTALEEDEWGAGMLHGDLMVGVSRGGRVLVCTGWKKALQKGGKPESMTIIECDTDGTSFDLGGWLSVRERRLMFEVQDRVYVVALDDEGHVQATGEMKQGRASWCYVTSSAPQLAIPVSFMAIYDDCIMHTYMTLGWRQHNRSHDANLEEEIGPARIFPTKTIRVLSLAPDLSGTGSEASSPVLWEPNRVDREQQETEIAQAGILGLVTMLGNQLEEEEDAMLEEALIGLEADDEDEDGDGDMV